MWDSEWIVENHLNDLVWMWATCGISEMPTTDFDVVTKKWHFWSDYKIYQFYNFLQTLAVVTVQGTSPLWELIMVSNALTTPESFWIRPFSERAPEINNNIVIVNSVWHEWYLNLGLLATMFSVHIKSPYTVHLPLFVTLSYITHILYLSMCLPITAIFHPRHYLFYQRCHFIGYVYILFCMLLLFVTYCQIFPCNTHTCLQLLTITLFLPA